MSDDNDGLSRNPVNCVCIGWPTGGELGELGHHQNSCLMHPNNLARDAVAAMQWWGAQEDGIPGEVWDVYSRLYRVEYGRLPTNAEDEL